MLGKLLRYDFKSLYKNLWSFYVIALLAAGLAYIFSKVDGQFWEIATVICQNVTLSMIIAMIVNGAMRAWVNFSKKMYGDESYLMHTLPTEIKTLYQSKVISALIVAISNMAVAVVTYLIAYDLAGSVGEIIDSMREMAMSLGVSTWGLISTIGIVVFLEMMLALEIGFTAIIAGYRNSARRGLVIATVGLGLYILTQAVMVGMVLILGMFNSEIMGMFTGGTVLGADATRQLMTLAMTVNAVEVIIIYVLDQRVLRKGVNVA